MARGFTVALVGPDGAGKSTIGRRLPGVLRAPSRYVYMGVNLEASTLVLPTTRLILEIKRRRGGRPDLSGPQDAAARPAGRGIGRRLAASGKRGLRTANLIAEEWFRQSVIWFHTARGRVVVTDRHFVTDYFFYDMLDTGEQPLSRRLHGLLLRRFYPRPDLVVFLDAPADVLLERKGESTLEVLERRRREYLELRGHMPAFASVDAAQPLEAAIQAVADLIAAFHNGMNASKPAWVTRVILGPSTLPSHSERASYRRGGRLRARQTRPTKRLRGPWRTLPLSGSRPLGRLDPGAGLLCQQ